MIVTSVPEPISLRGSRLSSADLIQQRLRYVFERDADTGHGTILYEWVTASRTRKA
jgi:hypothetical protein